ncbi:hypothetical protein GCM10023162_06110 [Klenkia terrae]
MNRARPQSARNGTNTGDRRSSTARMPYRSIAGSGSGATRLGVSHPVLQEPSRGQAHHARTDDRHMVRADRLPGISHNRNVFHETPFLTRKRSTVGHDTGQAITSA